jgi:hypothetical protein
MLRDDMISPVCRKIVAVTELACAISMALNRSITPPETISALRETRIVFESRKMIGAIAISGRELTRADRSGSIRIDVMLTKRRGRWRTHSDRREALA